eukprot:1933366-Amphidinium_carterae.1
MFGRDFFQERAPGQPAEHNTLPLKRSLKPVPHGYLQPLHQPPQTPVEPTTRHCSFFAAYAEQSIPSKGYSWKEIGVLQKAHTSRGPQRRTA